MDPKLTARKMLRWAVNTTQWTPTKAEWISGMRLIANDEEQRKINRYVFRKDAKHALIGRLMIRKCCDYFLGNENWTQSSIVQTSSQQKKLLLTRSDKGKPILLDYDEFGNSSEYEGFLFNISHSGDYCVLAADENIKKLGIDIMKIEYSGGLKKINNFFNVMQRQFSQTEWQFIRSNKELNITDSDKEAMLQRFMRLWCLKESFVKAEGTGIILPLSKISFICKNELKSPKNDTVRDTDVMLSGNKLGEWSFEETMLDHYHYVSIAKVSSDKAMVDEDFNFKFLTFKDLILQDINNPHFTSDDELLWKSEDKIRFQVELEFVQSLANPHYLNFLSQRGYFKEKTFVNYLEYLQYWKQPEYTKFLKYPMCLAMLDLLQYENFRSELASSNYARFIDDQMIWHWNHYRRKRDALLQSAAQKRKEPN